MAEGRREVTTGEGGQTGSRTGSSCWPWSRRRNSLPGSITNMAIWRLSRELRANNAGNELISERNTNRNFVLINYVKAVTIEIPTFQSTSPRIWLNQFYDAKIGCSLEDLSLSITWSKIYSFCSQSTDARNDRNKLLGVLHRGNFYTISSEHRVHITHFIAPLRLLFATHRKICRGPYTILQVLRGQCANIEDPLRGREPHILT